MLSNHHHTLKRPSRPGLAYFIASVITSLFVTGSMPVSSIWAVEQSTSQANVVLPVPTAPVTFGITGHYRIGRWTAVRINEGANRPDGQTPANAISIETLDGDGVRVVYQPADSSSPTSASAGAKSQSVYRYIVPGTEAAPLILRAGETTLASTRFPEFGSPSRGPSAIPNEMPWIVCIGDPLGVDQIGANDLLDRDAQIAVSIPAGAVDLPDFSLGYQGVDVVMINSVGYPLLKELNPAQQRALVDWIKTGGEVFLTLGESATQLPDAAPWFLDLLPIGPEIETASMSPSAIESYAITQTPLKEFVGARLPKDKGQMILTGRTTRRISTPLAVKYFVGFGSVTVLAADLETAAFADWPERMDLIQRVTNGAFSIEREKPAGNRITAFDDLVGQTRSTLDQFAVKRKFGFSVLALILLALMALIGPLDYLLVNRFLGKPLLGWLTFPLVALGLSGLLAAWSLPANVPELAASPEGAKPISINDGVTPQQTSPQQPVARTVQCNRIELVDVDAVQNIGSGFAWSVLYSHDANQFDVAIEPASSMQGIVAEMNQNYSAPFGTPGQAFGGIQIAGEDARLPAYSVAVAEGDVRQTRIQELAIAPRSSKSLATHLQFTSNLSDFTTINRRRGSELLEGKLTNPLAVDLYDAMLVYGNWVYLLPTRFRAESTIESLDDLRQKNFRWRLSRQEALDKKSVKNQSWSPSDFSSLPRMAEMLMFHDAVGGTRYTGLKNDLLKQIDLSHLLVDDRCMLVGRLREPLLDITLTDVHQEGEKASLSNPAGETLSMIRILLPVETTKAR